jgi:uncharacterized protein with NRDE domain
MCLLALYFQEFDAYPLVVAANRDEYFARPSAPPQILRENPVIYGGKDLKAGGTWLGVNAYGLLVGILNRRSPVDEQQDFRSRGLLCLDLLSRRSTPEVMVELERQQAFRYRTFNLVFADSLAAYVAYNAERRISWLRLERGLHVFGNGSVPDVRSEKLNHARLLFSRVAQALKPGPIFPDGIRLLRDSLSDHKGANADAPKDAICVHTPLYGTVSSSLLFYSESEKRFTTYYAPGPPCQNRYQPGQAVPSR